MDDATQRSFFRRVPVQRLFSLDVGLLDLGAFWRTRRATKAGEALYDLTAEQRKSEGLMDPWLFNLQESILALVLAVATVKLFDFVYGDLIQPVEATAPVRQYYAEIFADTQMMLLPFVIPLTLMLTAPTLAWGSLRKNDGTGPKRERATHAYLYIDGAHGFVAQIILMVYISFSTWASAMSGSDNFDDWMDLFPSGSGLYLAVLVLFVLSFYAAVVEFQIVMRRVPLKLFELNGYDPKIPRLFSRWWKQPNRGPLAKYTLVALVGTSLLGGLISLATTGMASGLSWALAFGKALLLGELG